MDLVLIFSIYLFVYLFIQSDVNKSRWKRRPLFTYENELLSDMDLVLIFSIYLFVYLFIQSDVNKSKWKRRPLFTYENDLL